MKTFAVTVDKTVYCVTFIVLKQLIAPQLCKESTESNENCVDLNVVLHQKFKFLILWLRGGPRKTKNSKIGGTSSHQGDTTPLIPLATALMLETHQTTASAGFILLLQRLMLSYRSICLFAKICLWLAFGWQFNSIRK